MSMRKACILALFLLIVGLCTSTQAVEVLVNAVVAEVNDRAITLYQVLEAAREPLVRLRAERRVSLGQQETADLLSDVLRTLIWNSLLAEEADRQLTEMEKQQAPLTVDRIVKDMIGAAGSLMNLRQQLDQLGLTLEEEKRRQTETQMVQMLLDREVKQLVSVRAGDVRRHYLDHQSDFHQPKQVRIRQILIRYDDYESKAEAGKVAEQVLEKLRGGGDFAHLAELYSHGPYSRQGGLWEFMEQGGFIGPVDGAAFSLGGGELSEAIEGPTGYHIIRVEDIRPERTAPFEEAQGDIQKQLYREHYRERYNAYVQGLQRRARIRINQEHLRAAVEHVLSQPLAALGQPEPAEGRPAAAQGAPVGLTSP